MLQSAQRMESQKKHPRSFSFEFFPPKTPEGVQRLSATWQQLAQLKPRFFSVTTARAARPGIERLER